jgi:hypothetical protein
MSRDMFARYSMFLNLPVGVMVHEDLRLPWVELIAIALSLEEKTEYPKYSPVCCMHDLLVSVLMFGQHSRAPAAAGTTKEPPALSVWRLNGRNINVTPAPISCARWSQQWRKWWDGDLSTRPNVLCTGGGGTMFDVLALLSFWASASGFDKDVWIKAVGDVCSGLALT